MIKLKNLLNESPIPESILSSTAASITKKLIQRGFDAIEAAAIVGNMWAESSFNPAAKNDIGAFGLLQWLGDRKEELTKFAKKKGRKETDLDTQLDFIKYELKDHYGGNYSYEANMFDKAMAFGKTILDKAEGFARFSERPNASELTSSLPTRRKAAYDVYVHVKGQQKPKAPDFVNKTVYPMKANGYVNVREDAYVDNGIIDNLMTVIKFPNAIGTVKQAVTGEDGKTWLYVKLASGEMGYVRSDVVTTTNEAYYIVQSGDTLSQISKQKSIPVDSIKRLNNLTSDTIKIGQKLKLY